MKVQPPFCANATGLALHKVRKMLEFWGLR